MSNVIPLRNPQERVASLLSAVPPAPTVEIRTIAEALAWGDEWRMAALRWQRHADRLETLLLCAMAHERASELLRGYAEEELERLRGNSERSSGG